VSSNVGLIYCDLDVDLQTPQTTTDGVLDWMGVAHMLGVEGVARDLKELGPRSPLLRADAVFLFAHKNVEPCEQQWIDSLGIKGIQFAARGYNHAHGWRWNWRSPPSNLIPITPVGTGTRIFITHTVTAITGKRWGLRIRPTCRAITPCKC
jgi:hypothetical protein